MSSLSTTRLFAPRHRIRILVAGALLTWSATVVVETQESSSRKIWDGVYQESQATAGKTTYLSSCAACHGENLDGIEPGPALAGPGFLMKWENQTLRDLRARISTTMPQDAPGSLTREQYTSILAYLLQANEAPAGTEALPTDAQALERIVVRKK